MSSSPVHKLGSRARVLLSSVFGPYAQDDEYGSRTINPMELHHNQVTRVQGGFSLRMFHRSFGLMMIQANLEAPCTLLDFPSRDRFVHEIENNSYDIVGISSIVVNIGKVKEMCSLIRRHLPRATIVIGGHIANKENLSEIIDADHIVKGEGIRWFRRFLGEDEEAPIRHPMVLSGFGARAMGLALPDKPGQTAAILVPSVGCPVGCNFCSTSAMFGGKGKFVNFYETGDELFSVMCKIEEGLKTQSFFVLDENFLLHRDRALRLLELMEKNEKSWALHVFSSARVLQSYSIEQLVGLGVSWVWMGLEGENSQYAKLNNVDTRALVKKLQSHGIRVLGSTIIGLESHTPENIDQAIDYAVAHNTDFHQFMLYTPVPGTPLFDQHRREGTLLDESEFPLADMHGQYRFNHIHPHFRDGQEEQFLVKAFQRDFEVNGPSLARMIETTLNGWQQYKNHKKAGIRARFAREKNGLRTSYAASIWAMKKWYRGNDQVSPRLKELLGRLNREFGWPTRLLAPLAGRYIHHKLKQEEERLAEGWTYEPNSFLEKNPAALAIDRLHPTQVRPSVRSVGAVTGELSPISAR
jgi:radical SAM superfamily enzyme YgiQ (UPF0313 family)